MTTSCQPFYSAASVRAMDQSAIREHGFDGDQLMAAAAAHAHRALQDRWPAAARLLVCCGAGNNGGDGYVLARLAKAAGSEVSLLAFGTPAPETSAARARSAWLAAGGEIGEWRAADSSCFGFDVIVDALLGTGLSRAPEGEIAAAVSAINLARQRGCGVLAMDIPSGLDADRGQPLAPDLAVCADLTVSFVGRKLGLHTGAGADHAGAVQFHDLELPVAVHEQQTPLASSLDAGCLRAQLPRRRASSHKNSHGHVLVVGGNTGMAGAALLAARAALRSGAGLVSIATRAQHAPAMAAAQAELMAFGVERGEQLAEKIAAADVILLGPGLAQDAWARSLYAACIAAGKPLLVDADALNLLAAAPAQNPNWVLTPHPGEAARLLVCENADVQQDRLAAVRALQDKFQGVVVLKGAGSLVRGQRTGLCTLGNPGMAVGGSGDVLAGVIAALMAQGLALETAAELGVIAHAAAGDAAAVAGQRGMLPSDIIEQLRLVLNP